MVSLQKNITWERFFLKNHTQNEVDKLVPNTFLRVQSWAYLWINSLNIYTVYLYCMSSWRRLSKYIETKLQTTFLYFLQSFFQKKKRPEASISASFCAWFLKKNFRLLYSIDWPNFIDWLFLLRQILSNICVVIVC